MFINEKHVFDRLGWSPTPPSRVSDALLAINRATGRDVPVWHRSNNETGEKSAGHVHCRDKIDKPRSLTHQLPLHISLILLLSHFTLHTSHLTLHTQLNVSNHWHSTIVICQATTTQHTTALCEFCVLHSQIVTVASQFWRRPTIHHQYIYLPKHQSLRFPQSTEGSKRTSPTNRSHNSCSW